MGMLRRVVLVADTFPPLRTSGAVQLRDLSREFARQGYDITVMVPGADLTEGWRLEDMDGVRVLRLRTAQTKDVGYVQRTLAEFLMPFLMRRQWQQSPLAKERWDGVVWYAPSIFLGPLARTLKKASGCRAYLIVRDIFPEWAVDMGLMGRGLPYYCFKGVEAYQYSVADVIGVQTPGNLPYLAAWASHPGHRVEVLQNWLAPAPVRGCTIDISRTPLAGRKIFVYAGNMGVAQGMDILLSLAASLRDRMDIGFLFVGRGSEAARLSREARDQGLDNVVFHDEISPDEIPGLYAQCHVGLVALDPRHRTHNIPGKFLTYMQSGLPVLARINAGNDLFSLVQGEQVGCATSADIPELRELALEVMATLAGRAEVAARCRNLSEKLFSARAAVAQIVSALEG